MSDRGAAGFALALALLVPSCNAPAERAHPRPPMSSPASAEPPPTLAATPPEAPLGEGQRTWEGMVTPTKGGYVVGSVVVDPTFLERLLAASAIDVVPREPDWFLGAVVRVTGLLVQRTDEGAPEDGVQVQRRSGSWLEASRLDAVVLVTPAMMVEGALTRSKGLYAIDKVLVGRHDVAWSLGAVEEGARVRLWGQLHVQVCDPRAQCLTGGSLPIFQVGRAKRLP